MIRVSSILHSKYSLLLLALLNTSNVHNMYTQHNNGIVPVKWPMLKCIQCIEKFQEYWDLFYFDQPLTNVEVLTQVLAERQLHVKKQIFNVEGINYYLTFFRFLNAVLHFVNIVN